MHKEDQGCLGIIVGMLFIVFLIWFHDNYGSGALTALLLILGISFIALVFLFSVLVKRATEKRRASLMTRFKDKDIVDNILNESIWEGMSEEHLRESIGQPDAIDDKKLKTKHKKIWKYGHQGGNRYRTRVIVEDGSVVGWDIKD